MLEISNNPAFFPALGGFLGGAALVWLIASIRGRLARLAALAREQVTAEKISNLKSEISALETTVSTLRSSEARLIKHQGELETLAKSKGQQAKDGAKLVEALSAELRKTIQASEKSLREAIERLPAAPAEAVPPKPAEPLAKPPAEPAPPTDFADDDLDFVPLESLPAEDPPARTPDQPAAREAPGTTDAASDFEGFTDEATDQKAESAANAFRAALREND